MQKMWWVGIGVIVLLVFIGVLLLASERQEKGFAKRMNATELLPQDSAASVCAEDEDCVPASCCHAQACVSVSEKPSCGRVYCTQVCEPGTLDCGQARCGCKQGKCAMVPQ
jgi:hypothetical protein